MRHDETQPGGYYIGADGTPHDANGNPLPPRVQPELIAPLNVRAVADKPESPRRGRKPNADR